MRESFCAKASDDIEIYCAACRSARRRMSASPLTARDCCSAPQLVELAWSYPACSARPQPTQLERTECDTLEREHPVSDRIEHPAHDPFATFMDGDVEHRLAAVGVHNLHACRRRPAVVELDAGAQRSDRRLRGSAAHANPVALVDLVPRMHQPIRELAVVGEQDQAGTCRVESADRI